MSCHSFLPPPSPLPYYSICHTAARQLFSNNVSDHALLCLKTFHGFPPCRVVNKTLLRAYRILPKQLLPASPISFCNSLPFVYFSHMAFFLILSQVQSYPTASISAVPLSSILFPGRHLVILSLSI